MGLDMYLEKRTYVQRWSHISDDKQFTVTVTRGGQPYAPILPDRVTYVIEQVAYWRKANAVHRWFVENVQHGKDDCGTYEVSREQLEELVTLARTALESKIPAAVLPTQSGFFFGSTEYGEDYRIDMQDTVQMLTFVLAEPADTNASFYYRSSW